MIPMNSAIGILVFLVSFMLVASLILSYHAHILHQRSVDILVVAYEWLEENRRTQHSDVEDGTEPERK